MTLICTPFVWVSVVILHYHPAITCLTVRIALMCGTSLLYLVNLMRTICQRSVCNVLVSAVIINNGCCNNFILITIISIDTFIVLLTLINGVIYFICWIVFFVKFFIDRTGTLSLSIGRFICYYLFVIMWCGYRLKRLAWNRITQREWCVCVIGVLFMTVYFIYFSSY